MNIHVRGPSPASPPLGEAAHLHALRDRIERTLDEMVDLLDSLDGDADFEPSLGHQYGVPAWAVDVEIDAGDDAEEENEHGGDPLDAPEPWLGSVAVAADESQDHWSAGFQGPAEPGLPVVPPKRLIGDLGPRQPRAPQPPTADDVSPPSESMAALVASFRHDVETYAARPPHDDPNGVALCERLCDLALRMMETPVCGVADLLAALRLAREMLPEMLFGDPDGPGEDEPVLDRMVVGLIDSAIAALAKV